jgi:hypothetical protein
MTTSDERELPTWLKVSVFTATLLAVTWLAMFVESAARR